MSTTLEYKGYNGTVEFSAEDHVFHGTLSGLRDSISFEGDSVASLEENFRNAVDEYLAFCEAEGKVPDQPFKGSFNVRIPQELHKRAALYAMQSHKKLNKVVTEALEVYLVEA